MGSHSSNNTDAYLHDPHFKLNEQVPACDHCTYFKGIVYRVAVRYGLTGENEVTVRQNNMASRPRSLESIALVEEAYEQRYHAKYMEWCKSITTRTTATPMRTAGETARETTALYSEESDTLTRWIESSTKEELLAWFAKHGTEQDDLDNLMHMGIFDLRHYIVERRNAKKTTKKSVAPPKHGDISDGTSKLSAAAAKAQAARKALVQKQTSIKPPQAALRQREELRRWYDSKKAPELKEEVRYRGIIPVPKRKHDMIDVLVADDKKGT